VNTIALAIPHTPWIPERVASMARLQTQLGHRPKWYKEFITKAHFSQWATDLWAWLESTEAEWCLTLQDDVLVSPDFWPDLRKMIEAFPSSVEIVCLESAHPATPLLYAAGEPWYSTPDQLIGTAYMVRRETLRQFRLWRETMLNPGAFFPGPQCVTEDTLLGIFASVTGRKIYSPTRTIVDHDLSIKSTYSNESHTNRRPRMRWDNCDEMVAEAYYWQGTGSTPVHLGRFYGEGVLRQIAMWVIGMTETDLARLRQDDGHEELRHLIGAGMNQGLEIELCCLCARNIPSAVGMTGLKVCAPCIGMSSQMLLARMVAR
jgi:hypothetical protein